MKTKYTFTFIFLFTSLICFNSCKRILDSTGEVIYYTSFEQEAELNGWDGLSADNFRDDTPNSGGNKSVFISGGCQVPTAKYTLKAVGVEQKVSFTCYGKNLSSGGTVFLCLEGDINFEISINVQEKDWTFYECRNSIIWPANKDLSICLFSGGFSGSSMLIDDIRVIKK